MQRRSQPLIAAFHKGHIKVVKWMINHLTQFSSDQEMTRYIDTISDKELLKECHDCVKAAKDQQSTKAKGSIFLKKNPTSPRRRRPRIFIHNLLPAVMNLANVQQRRHVQQLKDPGQTAPGRNSGQNFSIPRQSARRK